MKKKSNRNRQTGGWRQTGYRITAVLAASAAVLSSVVFAFLLFFEYHLPDTFYVREDIPFAVRSVGSHPVPAGLITPVRKDAALFCGDGGQRCRTTLSLFGKIPIKSVSLAPSDGDKVCLGGYPFGLKMFTEGVMIVAMTDVTGETGKINPASDAGLRAGDIILTVNGKKAASNKEVADAVQKGKGAPVRFRVMREKEQFDLSVQPVRNKDGHYRMGTWLRDSSAGIGTMTFIRPDEMVFGGLGHGICDPDTGGLLPLAEGEIADVIITGVKAGQKGSPGELRGYFSGGGDKGQLLRNCETGVYGKAYVCPDRIGLIETAHRQETAVGSCRILTTVDETGPRFYDAVIERVDLTSRQPTKNMVIRITDPALLARCGGIVQGMSGSPIIQDGKLIGAVTHVLVNDPTRGYGIFIENMLDASS